MQNTLDLCGNNLLALQLILWIFSRFFTSPCSTEESRAPWHNQNGPSRTFSIIRLKWSETRCHSQKSYWPTLASNIARGRQVEFPLEPDLSYANYKRAPIWSFYTYDPSLKYGKSNLALHIWPPDSYFKFWGHIVS